MFSIALSQDSKSIRKDIEKRNQELTNLRNEISEVEGNIVNKTKEAITTTEMLINIENKINLTEKLIRSLKREERMMGELIQITKDKMYLKENNLEELRNQISQRALYLYKYGRPSISETILTSSNWNELIYKIKYLNIVIKEEEEIIDNIENTVSDMKIEKENYQIALKNKKQLRNEHQNESKKLSSDKKKRKKLLNKIESDRSILQKELDQKQKMAKQVENLIISLQKDENEMKRREIELAKIRAEKKKATVGNFATLRGRMPWPIPGKVVTHFGTQRNPKLNTVTENSGIDILVDPETPIEAVLDGMVTTVTFLRGYGNLIIIDHGESYFTVYANVNNILVNENDYVQQYTPLAYSLSNNNDKVKFHFEIWGNKQKLDPEKWLK